MSAKDSTIADLRCIADRLEKGEIRLGRFGLTAGIRDVTELGDQYRSWEQTSHRRLVIYYCAADEKVPEGELDWSGWSTVGRGL